MRKYLISLPLLAAVFFLASFVNDKRAMHRKFDTVAVERSNISSLVSTIGRVQPANRVDIRAPIAGRAEQILVQIGDKVKQGDVLMNMSSMERAGLLDAAETHGPKEVAYWEKKISANPIAAQINGIVIQRLIEPGQSFAELQNLFVLADRYVVEAPIDETDLAAVKLGQPVRVILDPYGDQELQGHVGSISYDAKVEEGVTTFKMKIEFDNMPEFVRVGMTANISFRLDAKKDVLVLPTEALKSRGGDLYVLVPPSSGSEPEERVVRVGVSDHQRIEIKNGLQEGDQVLIQKVDTTEAPPKKNAFGIDVQ